MSMSVAAAEQSGARGFNISHNINAMETEDKKRPEEVSSREGNDDAECIHSYDEFGREIDLEGSISSIGAITC